MTCLIVKIHDLIHPVDKLKYLTPLNSYSVEFKLQKLRLFKTHKI
jgi:hypothetical protein